MVERRGHAGDRRITDENVELPVTLVQRRREAVNALIVAQVERCQRCRTAFGADGVVKLFQAADRACDGNHVRAGAAERERHGVADTARGAGDERHPISKWFRHFG